MENPDREEGGLVPHKGMEHFASMFEAYEESAYAFETVHLVAKVSASPLLSPRPCRYCVLLLCGWHRS